jgi:pilus assembly protein CpaF
MLTSAETLKPLPSSITGLLPAEQGRKIDYIDWLNGLLADDEINEIMINRPDRIFVERLGKLEQLPFTIDSTESVAELANYLLYQAGKDPAKEKAVVHGILPSGNRFSVVFAPAAIEGVNISIRKIPMRLFSLDGMVKQQIVGPHVSAFLKALAGSRVSILISGGSSSGKTTLLNALSEHIGPEERLATIEDMPELHLYHKNVVRMEADDDGNGISQRKLLKSALRMRCDRIIMGEIRGVEAYDFLQAMNIGHDGSLATLHANSPRDALMRLEMMIAMTGNQLTPHFIHQQISTSLNIIIQVQRFADGKRRISHITEVGGREGDTIILQDLLAPAPDNPVNCVWVSSSSRNPKVQQALLQARQVLN